MAAARQAEVALARLDDGVPAGDRGFYQGKIAAARFFAATVLPRLAAEREITERTTLDLMGDASRSVLTAAARTGRPSLPLVPVRPLVPGTARRSLPLVPVRPLQLVLDGYPCR